MKGIVFGDLHFSDSFTGSHVNYFDNCIRVCEQIINIVSERKITHVFFAGDIVGVRTNERCLRHRDSLLYLVMWFRKLKSITRDNMLLESPNYSGDGEVYVTPGNHDKWDKVGDFDFIKSIGSFSTPAFVDIGCLRIHIIGYGEERRKIDLLAERGGYDVAVTHGNFVVDGLTNWYTLNPDSSIEISSLHNLKGLKTIVNGHIHIPAPTTVTANIDGEELIYLVVGCPTRPKKEPTHWDKTFGVMFTVVGDEVSTDIVTQELTPWDEEFVKSTDDVDVDELESINILKVEELSKVLDELNDFTINGGVDYASQVKRYAGIDKDACNIALSYLDKATNESNGGK